MEHLKQGALFFQNIRNHYKDKEVMIDQKTNFIRTTSSTVIISNVFINLVPEDVLKKGIKYNETS